MKRKSKLLFIVTVALMLFGAIEVMAQEQYCPSTCTAGPYNITFNGVYPAECKDVSGNSIPCYDYRYSVSGPTSGFNQVVALLPVCCQDPLITYPMCPTVPPYYPCSPGAVNGDFGDSPSKIYLPGAGDPTTKFGQYIGMVYGIRSEPSSTLPTPHIYSSSQITGPVTMQIKYGGKYVAQCTITGPRCADCGVPPYVPSVTEKRITIEGVFVKLLIDSDKCVQRLFLCDPENPESCIEQFPVTLTAQSDDGRLTTTIINDVSDVDGNQRCAWGKIRIGMGTCNSVPSGIPGKYFLVGDTCACISDTQCYPGYKCCGTPRLCKKAVNGACPP